MTDAHCNCGYGDAGVYMHAPDCPSMQQPKRYIYELSGGGWNDGRLGQAYDAVAAVLKERGEKLYAHPLLVDIELLDGEAAQ